MKPIRIFSLFSFIIFGAVVLAGAGAVQAADIAGQVLRIKNAVSVKLGDLEFKELGVGSVVSVGDRIVTGPNARVEMRMLDQSVITLGENSEFIIESYLFDREKGIGKVLLKVAVGTFRAVTGGIGTVREKSFALNTPVATIGIRGTDFWGGPLDGIYNIALLGGEAIYVENTGGRVEIDQVGYGTTVGSPDVAPTPPIQWGQAKLQRASDTVAF
ncbi:MAG: FecR family protein [Rhodospirillales bacterium]